MVGVKERTQERTTDTTKVIDELSKVGLTFILTFSVIVGIISLTALGVALVQFGPVTLLYGMFGLL